MRTSTITRTILNILLFSFIAAAFPACDDIYGTAQKQIKNGNYTSLLAMIFGAGISPYQAQSLVFNDNVTDEYVFGGNLIIGAPIYSANTIEYLCDYGSSPSKPYDSSGITIYQTTPYMGATTLLNVGGDLPPSGDTYLRVYTHYYDYATATDIVVPRPTSIKIHDMVFRQVSSENQSTGFMPWNFTLYNGSLYFFGTTATDADKLWRWNGTYYPEMIPYNVSSPDLIYSGCHSLVVLGTDLYFSATDATYGQELWCYDGTSTPFATYDLLSGTTGSNPNYLTVYNNDLYFQATGDPNAMGSGNEMWTYGGSSTPPSMVYDIYPGYTTSPDVDPFSSNPSDFTVYNNLLYFSAYTGGIHRLMFESDGTYVFPVPMGTTMYYEPTNLFVYNGKLFFNAQSSYQRQLFVYDGLNPPYLVFGDTFATANADFNPCNFAIYNGRLYYQATVGGDTELFVYDDRYPALGTGMVADIYSGASSNPSFLKVYDNKLFFSAYNGTNNFLWVYDDTMTVDYINNPRTISNTEPYMPQYLTVFNNHLCMQASNAASYSQLWEYFVK